MNDVPPGGWQPHHGQPPQQPGYPDAEPYPGYGDMHADHYRRQQEAAAQAASGPPIPLNPLRNMGNWGMPPVPGLNPQEQAAYDSAKRAVRARILRLVAILAFVLVGAVVSIVRNLL